MILLQRLPGCGNDDESQRVKLLKDHSGRR